MIVVRTLVVLLALLVPLTTFGACKRSSGAAPRAAAESLLPDSAEQIIFGLRVTLTDRSVAKGELLADTAYTYDNGNRLELRRVYVTFFNGVGEKDGQLTAREGTYNRPLSRLEGRGDVILLHEDGRRLESQQLVFDELRNQVFSDSAFVLNEPNNRQVTGVGFESDPQLRNFRVLREAKGVAPVKLENE
jgi:LPS export ABC transporter protein LptC